MTLPGRRDRSVQLRLFDCEPNLTPGLSRFIVGEFYEEVSAAVCGGDRLRTNSAADICPDVVCGGTYIESKAVGRSGALTLYAARVQRMQQFVDGGNSLVLFLWRHQCKVTKANKPTELCQCLAKATTELAVVTLADVLNAVKDKPPRVVCTDKTRGSNGEGVAGSGLQHLGWRVPYSRLTATAKPLSLKLSVTVGSNLVKFSVKLAAPRLASLVLPQWSQQQLLFP